MTDTHSFVHLLLVIAAVLFTTRVLSVLAEKFGQPAILGEVFGGMVLGAYVDGAAYDTVVALAHSESREARPKGPGANAGAHPG